jgi:hypothetical protein
MQDWSDYWREEAEKKYAGKPRARFSAAFPFRPQAITS